MNFKIENNFLDITNYPYIEKHFEKMASQGWLITRIIIGNIFIYRKIKPEDLDFSISPYEVETTYTRKTKEELEEFQSVCKSVGWNYATKSYDLHIYFKEAGTEAMDISTDEEEEFRTLERIGKRQIKGGYILIPIYLFLAWTIIGGIFRDIHSMKDGLAQIIAPIIPIFLVQVTYQIIKLKRFLKTNKNKIETGEPLEYINSKFVFERVTFGVYLMFLILFIFYSLYAGFVLKNKIILIGLTPIVVVLPIGLFYRIFIKPSKKTFKFKKISLGVVLILTTIVSINITFISINSLTMKKTNPNIEGYRALSVNDFDNKTIEDEGDLMKNSSFLIPKSYEYWSFAERDSSVTTEYSNALTEGIAKNLVDRYKKHAEYALTGRTTREIDIAFEEDLYDDYLAVHGLSEDDFNRLKVKNIEEAIEEAENIIKEESIIKDQEKVWNLDEVYFLNYQKDEIVIREGKEVFYLEGKDFSDPEIIRGVKIRLDL